MIKNYFKVAMRHLKSNKGMAFINIFGLGIGIAFALLIGLWIQYESSYDSFNKNMDRIGMIRKHTLFNNEKNTQNAVPLPLYDELRTKYPEVKRASRVSWNNEISLVAGRDKFSKQGVYVDPEFLEMFTFPAIGGNLKTALTDPNSIVLTESLAKAMFGTADPLGKTIRVDNMYDMNVSAVLEDVPSNSSIKFDLLIPFKFLIINEDFVKNAQTQWGNNFLRTVVEMKEGASMSALTKKLEPLMKSKGDNFRNQAFMVHPMSKWHLYNEFKNWVNTGGRIGYVHLFGIIGIFVLLIACINFMNLSTARSEKRAREVGIRKAIGSRRGQLIMQFLSESVFTAFLSFLLAIGLIQLALPALKDLGFENVRFDFGNIKIIASALGVCVITGLIAGSYPALYLSSFRPVKVLKGLLKQGKGPIAFRRVLVVSQFAISIGLIISTIIVFQQINFAKSRPLGYNPDNLLTIGSSEDLKKNFEPLKQELLQNGMIEAVSKASSPMTAVYNTWSDFNWDGKPVDSDIAMNAILTEWDYEKTAGLRFIQGRPFSREFTTDSTGVILNEAALATIKYKNPIGRTMKLGKLTLTIVGIVENVVMEDPFEPVQPTAILFNPNQVTNIHVRLRKDAGIQNALAAMKTTFEKYNPSIPFEYSFVDESFASKFKTENQVGKLAGIFAGLAILISCLGLFGLATFMAERRTKEIGIRKVLGAPVSTLWMLLSKEFVALVLVACLIASPSSYFLMNDWLLKYNYRIDIGAWIFIIAAIVAIVIALITVSVQTMKAALANPVKSLRTE